LNWKIEWDERALKELKKISNPDQKLILKYLTNKIQKTSEPKMFGKPLIGNLSGLWRYRVMDYRLICNINEQKLTILILSVGHRKKIYI
jgi:mRNA interferase RelE/StbE